VVEAVDPEKDKVEPVDFLDLGGCSIGWMDGVGTRIVGRDIRDVPGHGLEDGGILGEDEVSEKPVAFIGRDGRGVGVELDL
jgi:hypothetical protein